MAWEHDYLRLGSMLGGLNLRADEDAVPEGDFTDLLNVRLDVAGYIHQRLGLTEFLTAGIGDTAHSIRRLRNPIDDTYVYIAGIGSKLYTSGNSELNVTIANYSNSAICFTENGGTERVGFVAEGDYTIGATLADAVELAMDNAGSDPIGDANLQAWYRADTGLTVDSGGAATDWDDQSGTAGNLSNTQDPLYYTEQINGWPGVFLDSGNGSQALQSDAVDIFDDLWDANGQGTVIAVVKMPSAQHATSGRWLFTGSGANSNSLGLAAGADNLIAWTHDGGARTASINISAYYGEWVVICFMKDAANVYAGVQDLDTAALASAAAGAGGSPSGALRLGYETAAASDDEFTLAEIMFFDAALSEAERQGIAQYLSQKYGATVATGTTASPPTDEYTGTFDVPSRAFTLAGDGGNYELNWLSGSHADLDCGEDIGFDTAADDTGAATYTGDAATEDLVEVDNNPEFSGSPLFMVPYRPLKSGKTWMYICDGGTGGIMRKVRSDGVDMALGLNPPAATESDLVTVVSYPLSTEIDTCELTTGWADNEVDAALGTADAAAASTNRKAGAYSLELGTTAVGAAEGYTCFWNKDYLDVIDMTKVGGLNYEGEDTSRDATDDDHIHLWMRIDKPSYITEVRVYFVVSDDWSDTVLPGTDPDYNTNAFMKIFRPAVSTPLVEAAAFGYEVTKDVLDQSETDNALEDSDRIATDESEITLSQTEQSRLSTVPELAPGQMSWTEFGVTGRPLRRGSFYRIGSDECGWDTVRGMVVMIRVQEPQDVTVWLDDIYLHGGYGPDTSEVGSQPYDYRYIHYDTLTGARSNPSPIQEEEDWKDATRAAIRLYPTAYDEDGDGTPSATDNLYIRQRFFRRGGTLVSNWYYVGQNSENGGCGLDTVDDTSIQLSDILEFDNFRPVPTVNAEGIEVRAQPLRAMWGPVSELLLGCGDPYRPGHLYWCKPGEPDHWPDTYWREVCSPSEELMAGSVYGSQAFVFSRERLYACYPSIGTQTDVAVSPTQCTHGLAVRWALTTGPFGIFFLSHDGIFYTQGGPEVSVTDKKLKPIFTGGTDYSGTYSIDWDRTDAIRLVLYGVELWFQYVDTAGTERILIYDLDLASWREYNFSGASGALYADEGIPESAAPPRLVLGSTTGGLFFEHSGINDNGVAFTCRVTTGYRNQGYPDLYKAYSALKLDMWDKLAAASFNISITFRQDQGVDTTRTYLTDPTGVDTERVQHSWAIHTSGYELAYSYATTVYWTPAGSDSGSIYAMSMAYELQPATQRAEAIAGWDHGGVLADKWVKGVIIELDTFNQVVTFIVEADGAATGVTFSATANGRKVMHFPWTQVRGRLFRLRVAPDTPSYGNEETVLIYNTRWIFDEEPLGLERWETQWIDHGQPSYHSIPRGFFTIESTEDVIVTLSYRQQDGTEASVTATLPDTGGEKRKLFASFAAHKGVLFKYVFTSETVQGAAADFYLYKEESSVVVLPWAGGDEEVVSPFGTDDLDRVRNLNDAGSSTYGGGK